MVPQSLPLPTMGSNAPSAPNGGQPYPQQNHTFDTTGQIAPPGMKPRVTATLWEDEGSLCFQVEANGVCVARREDNHMINGTKLLNVAGMTRGRRDGILKSEKTRHVVKIGPMHLKGVWIPFDRALDFANKEKITELLYPLFVHNIGALLYHPTNQARQSISNAAVAARRPDQTEYLRTSQGTQPPALTHHHSMNNPIGASNPQLPHSIAPHPASGRPGYDRAHSFPTPPQNATNLTIGLGNAGSSYEYGGHGGAINSATTPPANSQAMHYQTSQAYDNTRPLYSAPSTFAGQYGPQASMTRYGALQSSPSGVKNEMGPPARAGAENEHPDVKSHDGYGHQPDADGDHEGPLHSDPSHISPEMTHSPHQNGSGRATPRTTTTYAGYSTPQRPSQLPSSNLNYVMSNDARAGAQQNGTETYSAQAGYPTQQYPSMNGASTSNKRMREDEDQIDPYGRPLSAGGDPTLKRQRTDPGVRPISQPHSIKAGGMRR